MLLCETKVHPLLKEKGLTVKELAQKVGVSRWYMSRLICGYPIGEPMIQRICGKLNVGRERILEDESLDPWDRLKEVRRNIARLQVVEKQIMEEINRDGDHHS